MIITYNNVPCIVLRKIYSNIKSNNNDSGIHYTDYEVIYGSKKIILYQDGNKENFKESIAVSSYEEYLKEFGKYITSIEEFSLLV